MPSSEDCIIAKNEVRQWAIEALVKEGHAQKSAEMIVDEMDYNKRIKYAEKIHGPIYRGPYSPY